MIYIRDISYNDVESVADLYEEVALKCKGLLYNPKVDKIDLKQTVHDWISTPRSVIKVLCNYSTDEVIGIAVIYPESTLLSRVSHVGELFMMISPQYQCRGYGTKLLSDALHNAFNAGYEKIVLEVADDNKSARALYSKLGFMCCGARYNEIKYEPNKYVNTLLMELHGERINNNYT